MNQAKIIYDDAYDMLYITVEDKEYAKSIELGAITLDIDTQGHIKGMSVSNASTFFKIDPEVLRSIVSGQFNATIHEQVLTLFFQFKNSNNENFTQQIIQPLSSDKMANFVVDYELCV